MCVRVCVCVCGGGGGGGGGGDMGEERPPICDKDVQKSLPACSYVRT